MASKRGRGITDFATAFPSISGAYIPPVPIRESRGWLGINQLDKLGNNLSDKLFNNQIDKLSGNIRGN